MVERESKSRMKLLSAFSSLSPSVPTSSTIIDICLICFIALSPFQIIDWLAPLLHFLALSFTEFCMNY